MEAREQIVYRKRLLFYEKEDKRIHAMLRKYEESRNHVEVLMAEEDEEVSLPETNKREQSTEKQKKQ